jgi:hypothetical protein
MIEENTPLGCCCRGTIGFEAIANLLLLLLLLMMIFCMILEGRIKQYCSHPLTLSLCDCRMNEYEWDNENVKPSFWSWWRQRFPFQRSNFCVIFNRWIFLHLSNDRTCLFKDNIAVGVFRKKGMTLHSAHCFHFDFFFTFFNILIFLWLIFFYSRTLFV